MKLYNIKLRVISVQYSSLTIKSTPHLFINIDYGDYPLYEIESGLNHMGTDVFLYLRTLGVRECLPKCSVSLRENLIKPNKKKEDWI